MKAVLVCPSQRNSVRLLSEATPLVTTPLLGQSLVEYWLSYLATQKYRQVTILAHDRPERIEALVGKGERWGLEVEVLAESRELTPAQASLKLGTYPPGENAEQFVTVIDHFPDHPEWRLFDSYADWFSALLNFIPLARTPDRVGIRELSSGVWASHAARISRHASLEAPCFVGRNVIVGPHAVVGPGAVIEDGALIDRGASVIQSCVGADTFVGRYAELTDSVALGETLVNWKTGSITPVPDRFLLCSLRRSHDAEAAPLLGELSQLCSRNLEEAQLLWKHLLMNREG